MKKPRHLMLLPFAVVATASAAPVLLTSGADRAAGGRYLYVSANQPFLSRAFHPGKPAGLVASQGYRDGSRPAATIAADDVDGSWISFASGDLTDGATTAAGSVSGWQGHAAGSTNERPGPHVLFDLGAVYSISEINVRLMSASSYRWNATTDIQQVWTATSLSSGPGAGEALDSSADHWNQTVRFTAVGTGETNVTLPVGRDARYVLLRLTAGAVDSGNAGGVIREFNIHGEPVAVPGAAAGATPEGDVVIGAPASSRSRPSR